MSDEGGAKPQQQVATGSSRLGFDVVSITRA
jgi:hypothetical protein